VDAPTDDTCAGIVVEKENEVPPGTTVVACKPGVSADDVGVGVAENAEKSCDAFVDDSLRWNENDGIAVAGFVVKAVVLVVGFVANAFGPELVLVGATEANPALSTSAAGSMGRENENEAIGAGAEAVVFEGVSTSALDCICDAPKDTAL